MAVICFFEFENHFVKNYDIMLEDDDNFNAIKKPGISRLC
jgi:hypothetical protein